MNTKLTSLKNVLTEINENVVDIDDVEPPGWEECMSVSAFLSGTFVSFEAPTWAKCKRFCRDSGQEHPTNYEMVGAALFLGCEVFRTPFGGLFVR